MNWFRIAGFVWFLIKLNIKSFNFKHKLKLFGCNQVPYVTFILFCPVWTQFNWMLLELRGHHNSVYIKHIKQNVIKGNIKSNLCLLITINNYNIHRGAPTSLKQVKVTNSSRKYYISPPPPPPPPHPFTHHSNIQHPYNILIYQCGRMCM